MADEISKQRGSFSPSAVISMGTLQATRTGELYRKQRLSSW